MNGNNDSGSVIKRDLKFKDLYDGSLVIGHGAFGIVVRVTKGVGKSRSQVIQSEEYVAVKVNKQIYN